MANLYSPTLSQKMKSDTYTLENKLSSLTSSQKQQNFILDPSAAHNTGGGTSGIGEQNAQLVQHSKKSNQVASSNNIINSQQAKNNQVSAIQKSNQQQSSVPQLITTTSPKLLQKIQIGDEISSQQSQLNQQTNFMER